MYLVTKVLIGTLFFTSPTGDKTAILSVIRATPRSSRLQCKGSTYISSYFKTLSNGPAPGIKPATFRSAVKRSTGVPTELILLWEGRGLLQTGLQLNGKKTEIRKAPLAGKLCQKIHAMLVGILKISCHKTHK